MSSAIASIRRRERLAKAFAACVPVLSGAAFALVTLRFAIAFGIAPASALAPVALGLLVAVTGLIAWAAHVAPRPIDAARELDCRAGAKGRIVAAYEFSVPFASSEPAQPASRDAAGFDRAFARAAVEDAESVVEAAARRIPELFPIERPSESSRALVMIALAPAAMLALHGATFDLARQAPEAPVEDRLALDADRLSRIADRLDLPTMKFVVEETKRLLAALPAPQATPVVLALGPLLEPTRGASITDPEAKKFFEDVLSGATAQSVGKEIVERFTEETRAAAYDVLESEFKTSGTFSGSKYAIGPSGGGSAETMAVPEMKGGGNMKPAVDPAKMKSDYYKDDPRSELMSVMKESFDAYLREFAAELLKGMEDALENELSGNGKGVGSLKSPKGLPASPQGMAESHGPTDGPAIAAKGGNATSKMQGSMALGGTQAGGVGAGAGGAGADQTEGGDVAGHATGERVDLGGTLDERLARIEVIRRMSGGSHSIEDSASAEFVIESSKAAEAEAASEDVPDEWRGAIEAYFRNVRGEKK